MFSSHMRGDMFDAHTEVRRMPENDGWILAPREGSCILGAGGSAREIYK